MKKNNLIKFFLKLAVSAGFLIWLILITDWKEVLQLLYGINTGYLFLYLIMLLAGIFISSYKWKILAEYKGIKERFVVFFKYYLAGTFINNFFPSFVGGDAFKSYQVGKRSKLFKESASAVIVDRLTGLVGALLLALVFATINRSIFISNKSLSIVYLGVLIGFHLFIFYLILRRFSFWKKIGEKMPRKIANILSTLNSYGNSAILRKAIFYSALFSIIGVAFANYLLFLAFGAEISFGDFLSVIFLISIVASIPISVNNIGVKEWAYVTFFSIFGISSSLVVAVAILSRFIQMAVSFFAIPVYLNSKKTSNKSK